MPRTTDQDLLAQLLSAKTWFVYFYDIEIFDRGVGTANGNIFTDETKSWQGGNENGEWVTQPGYNNAVFIDANGTEYPIVSNTENSITLPSGSNPPDGEYRLQKFLYLTSIAKEYTGSLFYELVRFNNNYYLPFPVKIGTIENNEIGSFPQLTIEIANPSPYIDLYRAMERYNGLRKSRIKITTAFLTETGQVIEDPDVKIVDEFIVESSTITASSIVLTTQSLGGLNYTKFPTRKYSRIGCSFAYKDKRCKYTGNIDKCNKQFILYVPNLYYVKASVTTVGNNDILTLSDVSGFTSNSLVGNKVEVISRQTPEPYIWEIIANESNTLTVTSKSASKRVSDFLTEGFVTINVIDKYCCKGHCSTGSQLVPIYWTKDSPYAETARLGSLLLDTESFFSIGKDDSPWSVTTSNAIVEPALRSKGVHGIYITKSSELGSINISQTISYEPTTYPKLEIGQTLIFYARVFGFSLGLSDAYIRLRFTCLYKGTNYTIYHRTPTGEQSQYYSIKLYPSTHNLSNWNFVEKYIKPDEILVFLPLDFNQIGGRPYNIDSFKLEIISLSNDQPFECIIMQPYLIKYIPTEHFGGFTGLPMSGIWYVA